MHSDAESTPSVAPLPEAGSPMHDSVPLEFPTDYRGARRVITMLTGLDGYSMRRLRLDAQEKVELAAREQPIITASQPLQMRGQPLSAEHRRMMEEVFAIMKVPGSA
ncbi:TPA: hypothetical protein DCL30_03800 [Candidatus Peribacteria bacterium]|nr:MAG: hypothetical protein A3J91_00515 [Candidatus Peribacteria bacterium RIFOXYC2_FULL_58_10]OGJ84827.1 MAG: hypothetical protein A2529_00705 [Candidatus Peribacteria bacterium RIFOXYD2_FULL_58_15]HAI98629.1 hypothetical protein [Candidatus Peribacteria bacterium]HAS34342.1 hypothetical protein [Candidatus Peribacteria bacterium]